MCACLQLLPFCGSFTSRIIHQLLASGTCDPLERYRVNQVGMQHVRLHVGARGWGGVLRKGLRGPQSHFRICLCLQS